MRTVLVRAAGRATLIFVSAGMVGSAAFPAVPAAAGGVSRLASTAPAVQHSGPASTTQIGTAVKYVRYPDGSIHRVR